MEKPKLTITRFSTGGHPPTFRFGFNSPRGWFLHDLPELRINRKGLITCGTAAVLALCAGAAYAITLFK